jgi:uncharacterized membrane-anchored protein
MRKRCFRWLPMASMCLFLIFSALALAAPNLPDAARNALEAAFQEAGTAIQKGPANLPIAGQAMLQLPMGYNFFPAEAARNLLEAMGNPGNENVQGMIFPSDEDGRWFIVVSFNPAGYIRDDDAKDWQADTILAEIRKGTEAANDERRSRGLPELDVAGWVEQPQYDAETHRLVWSLSSHLKGADPGQPTGINYNTLMLGREGFISLNLVTELGSIGKLKTVAHNMLASLEFDAGKRYGDFQAGTDKVAEYGLAALVAGVAAKKLGLLALAGVFFAKFAKIIIAAGAVGLGLLGRLFGKQKGRANAATPPHEG